MASRVLNEDIFDRVNDIYNALEMGASGLVLAGETAMGKYPIECVKLLLKIIQINLGIGNIFIDFYI